MAALYERARPGYPDDAVAYLAARLGLGPGRSVVDLAAGTGKLTRLLLTTGADVVAVEPLAEMRAVLAETAAGAGIVAATAEALPLETASVDAVSVGQAFHWFDAERAVAEIARVLRPGGALGLVWNVRDLDDPLQSRLQALIAPYRRTAPNEHERPWRQAFTGSAAFGPEEQRSFAWAQPHTLDQLAERFASVSFIAALDPGERAALLARIRDAACGLEAPFAFRYRTDVYTYLRTTAPPDTSGPGQ